LNCAAASAGGPTVGTGPGSVAAGTPLPPLSPSGAGFAPAPSGGGRQPGVLGTLPQGAVPAARSSGPAQFDAAMNLLGKAQYAEASAAFRAYADANPDDDDLSSQAIFWVGNIAFVQQDYPNAARAFAEELKKYPNAGRSPDAMLKLGQALLAQGQTTGGCTTLALISKKYPKAAPSTLAAAAGARKASCK
jgi:tol-pal system protein YbgF